MLIPDRQIDPFNPIAARATRRQTWLALALILLLAAALRLPALDRLPAGLHQDEAANEWNAYCLLKTGCDQVGVHWPIFYTRALGENRSTLFIYLLLPFQALGGMNLWTGRLPAAVGGMATVWLLYWFAARLFGRGTGLAAAALLAINPVHVQMSRWGHEANITPLLTLLPLVGLLWAGFPPRERERPESDARRDDRERAELMASSEPRPRLWRAALVGLLTGIVCYGYPAVRVVVPVFLLGCIAVTWREWRALLQTRAGRFATAAGALGLALTFGPLVYMHVAHADEIAKRARMTREWPADARLGDKARVVVDRYAAHFGPEFLFERGAEDETAWTVGFGFLPKYAAPLLLAGLIVALARARRSGAARWLLVGFVLFPAGDLPDWRLALHAQRAAAGLVFALLPAALGAGWLMAWLVRHRLRASLCAAGLGLTAMFAAETVPFVRAYVFERASITPVYHGNHIDLWAASQWLRPRAGDADAVFCTPWSMNHPHLIVLVALAHDPHAWFAEPRVVDFQAHGWDTYSRWGKYYVLDPRARAAALAELRSNRLAADGGDRPLRVLFVLRPDEDAPCPPSAEIRGPGGRVELLLYDCRL